nr:RNA-directed DNA polymerase, eukaryota, reverse transcriptase zinc-binding domain protein [Tanacetum cinerariifolium]
MGSILANGSPTSKFQFHKGLKQGDPLSPFLFIFIMESLHLSFSKVMDTCLYKGVSINESFTLSHLFYADDVVFVGEWSDSNINNVIHVLQYNAAKKVGCATLTAPLHYIGVKVGGSMSRKSSWTEVICKLTSRKVNWVGWNHVLASKEKGDLRVCSFFALNRPLLFKWVWRYISQIPSLWTRYITAIHGSRGALEGTSSASRNSPWLDIIQVFSSFKTKGIDILGFAKKKVGNGEKTLFWDDLWIGEDVLKSQFSRLFALESRKDISVAEKMSHPSFSFSFRRLPRGCVEDEQFSNLISCTSTFILPQIEDRWVWSLSSTGDFSVNSSRFLIDDKLLSSFDSPTIWVKVIPFKINIFAWRVWQDKLLTI